MRLFLSKIFGGIRQPARPRSAPQLRLEELNSRVLPSAGCGMASGGASNSAASSAASFARDFGGFFQGDFGGHDCGEHHATLAASLTDSAGATATATFSESGGSLFVTVKGAADSTNLSVTVTDNGTTTTVGTISTDASGNGHAKFTGVTAAAGDTITVGDLTGTFAQIKFTASLTGATGASGTATFNSVKNELRVSIRGAADSTKYNVTVNGMVVGQITTNKHGNGWLNVKPSGVTITSTSTISIADTTGDPAILTGTFA